MIKALKRDLEVAPRGSAISMVIGRRLEVRRSELGVDVEQVADKLGIPPQVYAGFESGSVETPASLLSQIADLFGVPVPWFFQDVAFDVEDEDELAAHTDSPGIFIVASEDQRVEALSECFRRLDLDDQQHLLAIAEALCRVHDKWVGD